ncbi:hypothetical protein HanOQP8_Chr13g0487251 [Helianthus annuus]|nr:hypothetical protein HanOQP8_Chr13g0487251 [Helianthus annuus]
MWQLSFCVFLVCVSQHRLWYHDHQEQFAQQQKFEQLMRTHLKQAHLPLFQLLNF